MKHLERAHLLAEMQENVLSRYALVNAQKWGLSRIRVKSMRFSPNDGLSDMEIAKEGGEGDGECYIYNYVIRLMDMEQH